MAVICKMSLFLCIVLCAENVLTENGQPNNEGGYRLMAGGRSREPHSYTMETTGSVKEKTNGLKGAAERTAHGNTKNFNSDFRRETQAIRRQIYALDDDVRQLNETFHARVKTMETRFAFSTQLQAHMLYSVNTIVGGLLTNVSGLQSTVENIYKDLGALEAKQRLGQELVDISSSEKEEGLGNESVARCLDGSFDSGAFCYNFTVEPMTWHAARRFCRQRGFQLAQFDSKEEQMMVFNWTRTLSLWGTEVWSGFWIGATDIERERTWIWVSGEYVDKGEYTDWLSGQPDSAHGGEDCMMILVNQVGAWNDGQCHRKYYALCQRAIA